MYADLDIAGPQAPSAIANSIDHAAKASLISGQFDVTLKNLSPQEVLRSVQELPVGHDRLSLDSNLVLLDVGAMLAYAPYRATVLLTNDPFADLDHVARSVGLSVDTVRIRLHDALLSAGRVITLSQSASNAMAQLFPGASEKRAMPCKALQSSGSALLIVKNDDDRLADDALDMIAECYGDQEIAMFDAETVFDSTWKLVLHLGFPSSNLPGARLSDAWAGGVPVVQLVNPVNLRSRRRRLAGQIADIVVEHGKSGLLCLAVDELRSQLADLVVDMLPARSVARSARHRVDPAAEWDTLLKAILQ
ncbi:MAG TPA: hypothetical protein VMF58_03505 [Rhizomicrobium sp.]|nr:hypothetical protein [Rhizomicrobium sp.]